MKITAVVSLIPEVEAKFNISNDKKELDFSDKKFVINPLDEFAVEEAIRTKEKLGGEVIIIAYSVKNDIENRDVLLRSVLAMGADMVLFLDNTEGCSPALVAKNITKHLLELSSDILFLGNQNIVYNSTELPVIISTLLNFNCLTNIDKVEFKENGNNGFIVVCERETENSKQQIELKLPCVLAVNKGINEPRYPKLPAIMKAKSKPLMVKKIDLNDDIIERENISFVSAEKDTGAFLGDSEESMEHLVEIVKKTFLKNKLDGK